MKKNHIFWWILGIGLAVTIIYFVYKYYSFPNVIKKPADPNNPNGLLVTDYGDVVNLNTPVLYGVKSNNATRLQSEINNVITRCGYSYTLLSVDGVPKTMTNNALAFISGNTLSLGTVTISQVMALQCKAVSQTGPYADSSPWYGGYKTTAPETAPDFSMYKN